MENQTETEPSTLEGQIPIQWKREKKQQQKTKRRRKDKNASFEACINMFHYLQLKDLTRNPTQGTCNCMVQIARKYERKTNLVTIPRLKKSRKCEDLSGLDHKHQSKIIFTEQGKLALQLSHRSKTSGDIVREQQDRSKRYKKQKK